jgi:hypothetical protein
MLRRAEAAADQIKLEDRLEAARVRVEEMAEMELLLIQLGAQQLAPVKILEELIIMQVARAEELGE